ncbi:MAG TPA: ABC transporter substrate-binding protein [Sporichthya sp.]|nr:ABC transporter substrate-binding protein [Sporichthya sp.]
MSRSNLSRNKRTTIAIAAVSLALVAGCGNRVDHDAVVAVGNGYGPVDAERDNQGALVPGTATGPGVVAPGAVDPGAVAPGAVAPGAVGPGGATPAADGTASTAPGTKPGSAPGATAVTASTACTQQLAPVVIGQTLASSGLVGAAIAGLRTGLAVWVKDINARGGLQCHPVQLTQLDDASDPARVSANWNQLVKDRGAVAIVGGGVPIAIAALRTSAERDKVPVVGGDVTAVDWVQSPYLFPTGGTPLTSYDGGVIDAAKVAKGPLKAGIFYCVEASICTGLKNNLPKSAERAGAALGPITAVSLTQPDFTSECQTMKAAGVNIIFFGLDGSASIRAARSCASLNYFPTIATGAIAVSAAAAADAGLRRNVTFLGSGVVPYMTTDTPGIKAFHDATKRYAPTAPEDQQTLLGWGAGKLLEAALTKVSAKARGGNITTQMILEGLWQLKNEKLDGLSPGATFTQGSPAKSIDCYYGLRLDDKGFGAPNGSKPVCFGADKKLESGAAAPAAPAAGKADAAQELAVVSNAVTARQVSGRRGARRRPVR